MNKSFTEHSTWDSNHSCKDILNGLSDQELIRRYRLDHAGVLFIADFMRLESPTGMSGVLTAKMKALITLCYLSSISNVMWTRVSFFPRWVRMG